MSKKAEGFSLRFVLINTGNISRKVLSKVLRSFDKNFERLHYSQMEKEFGKIKKGNEEAFGMLLLPMEGNALKIYRSNPSSNSRRLREAIALVLFDIKSCYTGEKYDLKSFRNKDNEKLEKALLMAFDPFTNEEIQKVIGKEMDLRELHDYYKVPVMCLLRIKESVDT